MGVRNIKKQLAGEEDILLGEGIEQQERHSGIVNVTKVRVTKVVNTIEDMLALDTTKFLTCNVTEEGRGGIFHFDVNRVNENDGGTILNGWVRQYEGPVFHNWFIGSSDTEVLNTIIGLFSSNIHVAFKLRDFILDFSLLSTDGKALYLDFLPSAKLNGESTAPFWFRDGGNGSINNQPSTLPTNGVLNTYQSMCDITNAGTQELYGYYFNLISDGSSNEPVRGVIGNVKGKGSGGEYKAIRVGAHDISTAGQGVQTLMAYSGSVSPTPDTATSIAMQLSHQPANPTPDKTVFMNFDGWDLANNRIQNGIVFAQGMEFNDAVLQASMDAGSSANARFLKLKDASANIKFSVEKDGTVKSSTGIVVGTNAPITIGSSSISRSELGGNIVINAGDTGSVLLQDGGVTTALFGNKGVIKFNGLPTTDPLVAGQLWNDAGILKISAG